VAVQTDMREDLRERLRRRPFVPFVITMNGGERVEILRGAQAAVGDKTFVVVQATGSGPSRQLRIADIASVTGF
jgi:hypothetical protein